MEDFGKLVIAIDGWSSCGKSTLAKALAARINYLYIDSGAMYRAVAFYAIQKDLDVVNNPESLVTHLDEIKISFKQGKETNHILLQDQIVDDFIRSPQVSNIVSEVAAISAVRRKLVSIQQELGVKGGIVMDGRDIGTVVFPKADLKLFITADKEVRARRRYDELIEKGVNVTMDKVLANLEHRDEIDSTRVDSPLRKADNAIEIDTTRLSRLEQLDLAYSYTYKKLNSSRQ